MATSAGGSDWLTWRIRDVGSGEDLPDVVAWSKFSGAAWRMLHRQSMLHRGRVSPQPWVAVTFGLAGRRFGAKTQSGRWVLPFHWPTSWVDEKPVESIAKSCSTALSGRALRRTKGGSLPDVGARNGLLPSSRKRSAPTRATSSSAST